MRIKLVAVGTKMPGWVNDGYAEYAKRMPRDMSLELHEIPPAKRGKAGDRSAGSLTKLLEQEAQHIQQMIRPGDFVVALEVGGKPWDTRQLAENMENWRMQGRDICLLIGGPDGLAESCRDRADQQWSLSKLTLPHPIVRVILAEQLYRAWTILQGHPYHRD